MQLSIKEEISHHVKHWLEGARLDVLGVVESHVGVHAL